METKYGKNGKVKGLPHKLVVFPDLDTQPRWIGPGERRFGGKDLHKRLWDYARRDWTDIAETYEANPYSFYNAWRYLNHHPMYWQLTGAPVVTGHDDDGNAVTSLNHAARLVHDNGITGIDVFVVRVDERGVRQADPALNTRTEVWLETGEVAWVTSPFGTQPGDRYHNYKIDTSAATYEEAVIRLARKVWKAYGNDRRKCEPEHSMRRKAKADKRQADGKVPWTLTATDPYAHPCAHRWGPGIAGVLARSMAEMRGNDE